MYIIYSIMHPYPYPCDSIKFQATLMRHLIESHHVISSGLSVLVLDLLDFPSGYMFHHNKDYIEKLKTYQANPYVFHMCCKCLFTYICLHAFMCIYSYSYHSIYFFFLFCIFYDFMYMK